MTNMGRWEQQLQQQLTEIRRHGERVTEKAAELRGHGEVRGVLMEVDASGEITSLRIAPAAMKWTSSQLAGAVRDCHSKARSDIKSKIERLLQKTDPRLLDQAKLLLAPEARSSEHRRPLDEAAVQEADDAFFERRNLYGGWTS
ncbi:YbaB/EbfC family nucleoid-associated protein [Nocardia barduliensis]|uniref:YbaB/EbfC family nucleoid-associated protein n=1 Tax=Nocardia barduliensis TaxID=2736643 RepID=UPI0015726097|nr:YbaB/EbfC family nucleoid-associated protein [Nocardia barduliensis]